MCVKNHPGIIILLFERSSTLRHDNKACTSNTRNFYLTESILFLPKQTMKRYANKNRCAVERQQLAVAVNKIIYSITIEAKAKVDDENFPSTNSKNDSSDGTMNRGMQNNFFFLKCVCICYMTTRKRWRWMKQKDRRAQTALVVKRSIWLWKHWCTLIHAPI